MGNEKDEDLKEIGREIRAVANTVTVLNVDASYMATEIEKLSKLITEGAGKGSILERLTLLEQDMLDAKKHMEANEAGKRKLIVAVAAGLLTTITSLGMALIR